MKSIHSNVEDPVVRLNPDFQRTSDNHKPAN